MNTHMIAHDAAVAATAHLDECFHLTADEAALVLAVIEAAVEAAIVLEQRRMLQAGEN